eukprot:COSAG01_NODE_3017_length_6713_cov_20.316752_3_plen_121_part_00
MCIIARCRVLAAGCWANSAVCDTSNTSVTHRQGRVHRFIHRADPLFGFDYDGGSQGNNRARSRPDGRLQREDNYVNYSPYGTYLVCHYLVLIQWEVNWNLSHWSLKNQNNTCQHLLSASL